MDDRKGFLCISDAPFLRFLLPFTTGIIIQFSIGGIIIPTVSAAAALLLIIRYYAVLTPRYKYINYKYFGFAIFATFLFAGSLSMSLAEKLNNSVPPVSAETAIAKLTTPPQKKERSIQCNANILLFGKRNGEKIKSNMPAILFLQTDTLSDQLKEQDIIIFKEKLQPITCNKNPYGYDYRENMKKKGYVYSQYIPSHSWEYLGHDNTNTIYDTARQTRNELIKRIENLNLPYRSEALVKALMAGDSSQITQSMRTSYSIAGLSHILAVSGLHTGIIAFVIYLLLTPLKYIGLKRFIPIITVTAVWIYVYIVGLPPSAVRASIMATVILVGDMIGRKGTAINSLMAAAFLMLLYNPYYIFDIGFQLSYTAVFSILYLYPVLISIFPNSKGGKHKLSSIATVTIAAQVGTLPLCIYYFHQIPLLGTISNIIVIPLLPTIMVLAIISLLFKNWFIIYILDKALSLINQLATTIEQFPFASINDIYIKSYYVVFFMIVIFCIAWGIRTKRSEIIVGVSCFVFLFTLTENINRIRHKDKCTLAIYDDDDITAINMASPWYNYVITPGITKSEQEVKDMAGTFWIANLMPEAQFVSDSIDDKGISLSLPYIVFGKEKIVLLDSGKFSHSNNSNEKLFIDKAIATWGFDGEISKVCEFFNIGEVIIASNVPWYIRNKILKECETLKIPYYDIKHEGAYIAHPDFRSLQLVSH